MNSNYFNLDYFSTTGFIGFSVLFIGLFFSVITFYFVFFKLNEGENSYIDRQRINLKKQQQQERIASLYPKES